MSAFTIVPITEQMIRYDEPMGSKDKFWCELPNNLCGGGHWLLKQPRNEPGKAEHVAEKIACEVCNLLQVECAEVQLAEFQGIRGTVARDFREPREILVHGNEVIAGRVTDYDPHRKRRTNDHTWERIRQAITSVCADRCDRDLADFAGYLVIDALIGNTDRHHENWGLLRRTELGSATHRLAPSFDHASSLGREMRDDRRARLLEDEKRMIEYIYAGRGAIYLADRANMPISPIELVENLGPTMSKYFGKCLQNVGRVTDEKIDAILSRMPAGWMTELQRAFSRKLLRLSRDLLLRIQL